MISGNTMIFRKVVIFGCVLLSCLFAFAPGLRLGHCDNPGPGDTVRIMDDLGQTVSLAKPASRIIPLYGAFAEMLFAVGAGRCVIARTQADKYPNELAELPSIGTHMRPDVELIIGLKPDLLIVSAGRKNEMAGLSKIAERGIPVAVFEPKVFEDIFSVIDRLGILCGHQAEAASSVATLQGRLNAVREKTGGIEGRKRVFFEIRAEPLTGAGSGSIVNDVIASAGGENVLKNEKGIVQYNLETLLFQNPDFYVVQEGPMNKSPSSPGTRAHFDRLKCVREGRVMFADELIFSRPGPRSVEAVERLAAALYPERFQK